MEVIPSTARGSGSIPLHQHNVEEWSRLDSLTGMLEHARVETGRWTANTSTSSQQYGKVVDSRARNLADGSMQQRQRKQLEVFQAQVPGGSLQVIRTQSVTSTSSSSSSWRQTLQSNANVASDFENIQLPVKPLDLSTQKTKASVGRSGSIGSRRPPSRPRSIISKVDTAISEKKLHSSSEKEDVDQRLSEVSRICQEIHEESKNNMSNSLLFPVPQSTFSLPAPCDNTVIKADNINRRDFSDVNTYNYTKSDKEDSLSLLGTFSDREKEADQSVSNGRVHAIITRNESCSIEDFQNNNHSEKDRLSEGSDMSTDLARTSVIRRSLQLPNRENHLYISSGSVSKFCQELQDGKALDAVKNNVTGFDALEKIFRYDSGSERNTSLLFEKNNQACSLNSVTDKSGNGYELSGSGVFNSAKVSSYKHHSFITVESLKEVRGRLRHLSAPSPDGIQRPDSTKYQTRYMEDSDDGIVIEDFSKPIPGTNPGLAEQVPNSCVKLCLYGMEAMADCRNSMNKSAGTGSLESRACNRSSSSGGSRSEEWYNRRKSYGFEQVHNQQTDNHSEPVTFQEKTRVESSTDSGIYRSSETVSTSSWAPFNSEKANGQSTCGNLKANHNIKIKQRSNDGLIIQTENRGTETNSQTGGRTVVTFGSDNGSNKREVHVNGGNMMETSSMTVSNNWVSGCDSRVTNTMTSNTSVKSFRRFSEPVTVTIPIVHDDSFNNINGTDIIDAKKCYLKQFSERSSRSIEDDWRRSGTSLTSGDNSVQKNLADVSKTLAARRELFQKHNGGNDLSPASKHTDNQIKRHSIAVDESKYVREGLKNYNLYDKRIGHINSENMSKTTSTGIPDVANCTGLDISNNKYATPLHKELECKIPTATGMSQDGSDFKSSSFTFETGDDDELFLQNHLVGKKHKKVEFCKTEVHFAAEPGRFNIVETDEKPPPNNIRRRRRSTSNSSSYAILSTPQVQDAGKTSLPEIRFGDSPYEMKLLGGTESNNTPYQMDVSGNTCNKRDVNHSMHIMPASSFPIEFQDHANNIFTQENATGFPSGEQDAVEIEVPSNEKDVCSDSVVLKPNPMTSTSARPRSILKNGKSAHFFHLGETDGVLISALNEKSETLSGDHEVKWGVRLKPIHNRHLPLSSTFTWKPTVTLDNPKLDGQKQQNYSPSPTLKNGKLQFPQSYAEGSGLSITPKSFQPYFQRKCDDDFVATVSANTQSPVSGGGGREVKIFMAPSWSVAERVRQVEDLEHAALETRGYSTKVNLVSGKTTVIDSRSSDEQQKQSVSVLPRHQQNSHQKSVGLHIDKQKEEAVSLCDHADGSSMLKLNNSKQSSSQKTVIEDNLQSYSSDVHPNNILVNTHSVHPKITSLSLQRKGLSTEPPPHVCDTNSDCDKYRTNFHISPSSKKGNIHVNEFEYPTDIEVNALSTTASSKSCNKPLFTLQNCNADSSKSLFTQKHKALLPAVVKPALEPESHTICIKHDERNYGNLNPRTQKRRDNNCLGPDHTMSLLGKKVLHPETEDEFVLYHTHNEHDYSPKCSSKQESDPMVLSNNMSLSSVLNKTTNKDQEKKQFPAFVPTQYATSVSSNTSVLVSNRKNSIEDSKKEKVKLRGEEIKRDGHFHVKMLSSEKHKHLDRTYNHESEEETEISDHYHERASRASALKSIKSLSTTHDRSVSSGGRVHSGGEVTMSPVYENMKMLLVEPTTKSSGQNLLTNTGETESDILEELTQAADQILQAVVGYTDEESCRASSDEPDDEIVKNGRRRRVNRFGKVQKPLVSLGTITEAPSAKKQQETRSRTSELRSHKSIGSTRKSQQIAKTCPHPTSSTSSLESFTREISQMQKRALLKQEGSSSADSYNKRKVESSSASSMPIKSGSRTARLFQRANSREHLLQTYTSSSEDVASGVKEENNRKPLVPRCTRSHNSSNNKSDPMKSSLKKSAVSPDSQPNLSAKVRARKRDADTNKAKERLPGTSNRIIPLVRKSNDGDSVKPTGGKLHTSRSREDRHVRGSSRLMVKRENMDLRHRAQGGGAKTMEPSVHDKSKRTVIHERVMGNIRDIGLPSASCVVPHVYPISASSVNHHDNSRTKKKLSLASSQNEDLVERKAGK